MSRRAVIGDVNIGPAIAVEVSADDAEAGSDGGSNSCFFSDVFERTVAAIMEQASRDRLVHFRRAIVPLTSRGITLLVSFHCEVQIVRYEKVQVPVVVIIDHEALVLQRGSSTPAWTVTSVKVPSPLL